MKHFIFTLICAASVFMAAAHQTDSIGVYAVNGQNIERIECLNYSKNEVSGAIFVAKSKLHFNGATSEHIFNNKAVFRLYFAVPAPSEVAKYYMFAPSYSAKDFGVVKFKVKKDRRELQTNKISMFGAKLGASKTKDVQMNVEQIRDNVYEITVTGKPGEYAITPVINGMAGYAGVFDFTLTE